MSVLACHENHIFHEFCYVQYSQAWQERGIQLICPIDRTPIQKDKVLTKIVDFEIEPEDE